MRSSPRAARVSCSLYSVWAVSGSRCSDSAQSAEPEQSLRSARPGVTIRGLVRHTTSLGRATVLALVVALGIAPACGSSSHGDGDDDDGGSSGENGTVLGGSSGASAARG